MGRSARPIVKYQPGARPDIFYMYHESFDNPAASSDIMEPMPDFDDYKRKSGSNKNPTHITPELILMTYLPVLSREQEVHLFRQMNFLKHKANQARDDYSPAYDYYRHQAIELQKFLVSSNYRLLVNQIKRMQLVNTEIFDAVGAGSASLINATTRFDFSRGFKFSTYACWSIIKWGQTYRGLLRPKALNNLGDEVLDGIPDRRGDDNVETRELRTQSMTTVAILLGLLPERERIIIELRNGLGALSPSGHSNWTLEEVGHKIGLTKERVRQLQVRAYRIMRQHKTIPTQSNHHAPDDRKNISRSNGFPCRPKYRFIPTIH